MQALFFVRPNRPGLHPTIDDRFNGSHKQQAARYEGCPGQRLALLARDALCEVSPGGSAARRVLGISSIVISSWIWITVRRWIDLSRGLS